MSTEQELSFTLLLCRLIKTGDYNLPIWVFLKLSGYFNP
jgi:hypothetical protein